MVMRGSPGRRLPYVLRSAPPNLQLVRSSQVAIPRQFRQRPPQTFPRVVSSSPPIFPSSTKSTSAVHDRALHAISQLVDLHLDDVVLTASSATPFADITPMVGAFLDGHGHAENIHDTSIRTEWNGRRLKDYHCGLDVVVGREQKDKHELYLTAGTRVLYIAVQTSSFTIAVQNTARQLHHSPFNGIPDLESAAIHRQAVRYHRPAGELKFLPLQFQAFMNSGTTVRSVAYRCIKLDNHARMNPSEYVALQSWLTAFWRNAGSSPAGPSCYFDKRRVEFVVRHNPPGAEEARSVMENVQHAYVLAMRDNLQVFLGGKRGI